MSKKFMQTCIGIFFITFSASIIFLSIMVNTTMQEVVSIQAEKAELQEEIITSALDAKEVVVEISYAVLARALEVEGIMTPSDTSKIVSDAIQTLSAKSEKLGLLAKSINDAYLKDQQRPRNR